MTITLSTQQLVHLPTFQFASKTASLPSVKPHDPREPTMKLAATALCLLAACVYTTSSNGKTINLRPRVNVNDDSVTVLKTNNVDAFNDKVYLALGLLSKDRFMPSTQLHKVVTMPNNRKLGTCKSATEQKRVAQFNYPCSGNQKGGFKSIFKLTNGTLFINELCDNEDKAALDKIFSRP